MIFYCQYFFFSLGETDASVMVVYLSVGVVVSVIVGVYGVDTLIN